MAALHTGRSSFDLNSREGNEAKFRRRREGGLQSGGEREASGRREGQGRAGNYVSGRPFVRLQSSLQHSARLLRPWKRDTVEERKRWIES